MKLTKTDMLRKLLKGLCFLSFILSCYLMYDYYEIKNSAIQKAKSIARQETIRAAKEIEKLLASLPPIVNAIVNDLNAGKLKTEKQIIQRIKRNSLGVTGVGIAFAPEAFDEDIELFAPYVVEKNGKRELIYLETFYDYSQGQFIRYKNPIRKGPLFLEPFFDEASNTTEAEFAAPFFYPNLKPRGVVFANYSTERIEYLLRGLKLGQKGYGFVISKKGLYVAHPNKDLPKSGKTIFDVADEINNPQLAAMAKQATEGFSGYIDHENVATGQPSWMFFEPIPTAGWSMVGVFIKDEIKIDPILLSQKRIKIILSLALLLFLLFLLFIKIYNGSTSKFWSASIAYTVLVLLTIIYTWYQAKQTTFMKRQPTSEVAIYDRATLIQYLDGLSVNEEKEANNVHKPPTEKLQSSLGKEPQTNNQTQVDTSGQIIETHEKRKGRKHRTISSDRALNKVRESLEQLTKNLAQTSESLAQESNIILRDKRGGHGDYPPSHNEKLFSDEYEKGAFGESVELRSTPSNLSIESIKAAYKDKNVRYNNIPTGIFLQSINFSGPSNIEIIGYIWQRFNRKKHKSLARGVVFPQATDIGSSRSQKAYEESTPEWDIVGWSIRYTLEQDFSYREYPFDSKLIQIQLWPRDFDKGVMLIPDLEAYKLLNPTSLPGIDPKIDPSSWKLSKSYFSFKKTSYSTNFGYYTSATFGTIEHSRKSDLPDLYFNIIANRDILNVLIIDLFPLVIVFIILFVALVMEAFSELSFSSVIGTCTSLFFTIILAHLRFRGSLPTEEVVFFEYLFFVAHFFILSVALISITFFLKVDSFVLRKKLFIPRIFYWPLLCSTILIVSLIFFY